MLDLLSREDESFPHDCFYINENEKMSMVAAYNDSAGSEIGLYVTSDNKALIKFVITKRQMLCFLVAAIKTIIKLITERGNK